MFARKILVSFLALVSALGFSLASANVTGGQGIPVVMYSATANPVNTSLAAVNMVTANPAGNLYRFNWYLTQTAAGSGCTGNSSIVVNVTYTDPQAASALTLTSNTYSITTNGAAGSIHANAQANNGFVFRAKGGTVVQYSTTFTAGTNCTTAPTYQLFPILEQVQ